MDWGVITIYENNPLSFDPLLAYFGDDYELNNQIKIHHPTIGEIARYGEKKYFQMIYSLCSIPSDNKSLLWDNHIDYTKISDFEYFTFICAGFPMEETSILFGDMIDFQNMVIVPTEDQRFYLYDPDRDLSIDELVYMCMIAYIRKIHRICPKVEKAANSFTKQILIDEDRQKRLHQSNKPFTSILLPLISGLVNSPGFKYNIQDLKQIGIYAFMDAVERINAIYVATAAMQGQYSGMVDFSKNPQIKKQLNWLRDLSEDSHHGSNVSVSFGK